MDGVTCTHAEQGKTKENDEEIINVVPMSNERIAWGNKDSDTIREPKLIPSINISFQSGITVYMS
jgi:hypothetical protein